MGLPTPRTAFVDLYVNDLHLGLYTQVEQIDKTFLVRHFSNPNGNLYKPEMGAAALNWTKVDLDKQIESNPESSRQTQNNNLAINMGGSRLSDLLKLLQRENTSYDVNQAVDKPSGFKMPFPGGPGGGFPGGSGGGFPFGPDGPFPQDANEMQAMRDRGFPFGPGGRVVCFLMMQMNFRQVAAVFPSVRANLADRAVEDLEPSSGEEVIYWR